MVLDGASARPAAMPVNLSVRRVRRRRQAIESQLNFLVLMSASDSPSIGDRFFDSPAKPTWQN